MPLTVTERLQAIEEIRVLKARYFRFVDEKNWDGFAALFAEDAIFDHSRGGSILDPWTGEYEPPLPDILILSVGREAIIRRIRSVVDDLRTVHQGFMPEITMVDADNATGVWAMSDQLYNREGQLLLSGYGHYNEEYRRDPNGWVIRKTGLTRLWVIRHAPA